MRGWPAQAAWPSPQNRKLAARAEFQWRKFSARTPRTAFFFLAPPFFRADKCLVWSVLPDNGELAQLVERVVRNDEVRGSNPLLSSPSKTSLAKG